MLIRRSGTQVIGERQAATLPGEVDLARASDFDLGPLHVQPSILQVQLGGECRTIEPRVMQVMVLLANERGSVVSRDRLIECCWGGRIVSEDAINRSIAKVRRLGEDSGAFEIETIPRVGYRLLPLAGEDSTTAAPRLWRFQPAMVVAAILMLAIMLGGIWYWRTGSDAPQPTVAVVPLTPLNSDPESRNAGQSITAIVTNALAQTGARIPDGRIGSIDDARHAGAQIMVSGTLRRDGPTLHATVRVDSALKSASILTNEFQAPANDASALGGQIAAWLIPSVRMWSSFLEMERDPAVTDEILRIFLTRSAHDQLRAWKLSVALAQSKPQSGSAQFVMSLLTSDVLPMMPADQKPGAVAAAREAATKATSLLARPERATVVLDCHLTPPGWIILTPKCDRSTRAAISADPDVPVLPFLFGAQLSEAGRFLEAAKFIDMDLAENPLGPGQLDLRIRVGRMMHGGDDENTEAQLETRMRRYLGPNAVQGDNFDVAIANGEWRTAEELIDNPVFGQDLAVGDARATVQLAFRAMRSKAPAEVAALDKACNPPQLEWTPPEPAFSTCLAALASLGDLNNFFALAARGYRDVTCCSPAEQQRQWLAGGGDYYPRWPLFGKAMTPARNDPRFIEVARRTGLLAYWKSGHPPDFCSFERAPVCKLLD